MSRFVFVSYPAWGHIDFGGGSYLGLARALADRGHEVTWVLPIGPDVVMHVMRFGVPQLQVRKITVGVDVQAAIERAGIAVERIDACLELMDPSQNRDRAIASSRLFAKLVAERGADACVVDRLAVVAGIGCHVARVPWCSMGGDGTAWTSSDGNGSVPGRHDAFPFDEVCDAVGADLPGTCRRSFWAMSPHLNLSFLFPDWAPGPPVVPTHFVGGASATGEARTTTLVTLGTTFARDVLPAFLAAVIDLCARDPGRTVEVLTGAPAITAQLAAHGLPNLVARDWAPYHEAFARASLAIGHGGNGFVWHSVAAGIPMLAVPTSAGDQRFGAQRLADLGLGARIEPGELVDAVHALEADAGVRARVLAMRGVMAAGGGVDAAVRLVEQLVTPGGAR